jgi:hypothetical protein
MRLLVGAAVGNAVGDAVGDAVGMGDGHIAFKVSSFLELLIKMLGANMGKIRQEMLSGR